MKFDYFAYMRALEESQLPALSRWLACVLARRVDQQTGVIKKMHAPSLTDLVHATGIKSRDTLVKHLDRLEQDGWLRRTRPSPDRARTEHVKTRYVPRLPASAATGLAPGKASPAPVLGLVRELDIASPGNEPELVRETDCKELPTTSTSRPAHASRAARLIAEHTDATDDEIPRLIDRIKTTHQPRTSLAGYIRTMAQNGDLLAELKQMRAEHDQASVTTELTAAREDLALRCPCGVDGGLHRRSDTGRLLCPSCDTRHRKDGATAMQTRLTELQGAARPATDRTNGHVLLGDAQ